MADALLLLRMHRPEHVDGDERPSSGGENLRAKYMLLCETVFSDEDSAFVHAALSEAGVTTLSATAARQTLLRHAGCPFKDADL